MRVLFAPTAPFHAAMADALRWWTQRHGLRPQDFPLPPVGCVPNPVRDVDPPDPPRLASQPDAVRLAVRAAENVEEAVLALCAAGAWTTADLAAATERAEPYVRAAVRVATQAGTLKPGPAPGTYVAA